MPKVLRMQERTLYPVAPVTQYDPYHDYYLIRKGEFHNFSKNLGMLKYSSDTQKTYIVWLDTNDIDELEYSPNLLKDLMLDFEIIELDNDEYCYGLDGHSVDFGKAKRMRKEILLKMLDYISDED